MGEPNDPTPRPNPANRNTVSGETLAGEAKDIMELAGTWMDVPSERIEEVMKSIREAWSS